MPRLPGHFRAHPTCQIALRPCTETPDETAHPALHRDGLEQHACHPPSRRDGGALWRTFQIGELRVRLVEYSPGYLADHWCDRGHVLYVLEGELHSELRDGRRFVLTPGMSYQVSDYGDAAHRSSTPTGARLFVVD